MGTAHGRGPFGATPGPHGRMDVSPLEVCIRVHLPAPVRWFRLLLTCRTGREDGVAIRFDPQAIGGAFRIVRKDRALCGTRFVTPWPEQVIAELERHGWPVLAGETV